jgi:hypothetical protein
MSGPKEKLVKFLERRVFDPILSASDSGKGEAEKRKLEHVKDATRSEKERFENYGSAAEVRRMFHDDLSSAPAKKIHEDSKQLGLPTLPDVKADFDQLADSLGVK